MTMSWSLLAKVEIKFVKASWGVSLQIVKELTPKKENRVILSLLRTDLRLVRIIYKRKTLIQNE